MQVPTNQQELLVQPQELCWLTTYICGLLGPWAAGPQQRCRYQLPWSEHRSLQWWASATLPKILHYKMRGKLLTVILWQLTIPNITIYWQVSFFDTEPKSSGVYVLLWNHRKQVGHCAVFLPVWMLSCSISCNPFSNHLEQSICHCNHHPMPFLNIQHLQLRDISLTHFVQ